MFCTNVFALPPRLAGITPCRITKNRKPVMPSSRTSTTAATHHVEMTKLLGDEALGWAKLSREPETRVWLYGKRAIEPGRKMGHVNRLSPLDRAG